MSSFSSFASVVGASLPFLFLGGLVWATSTLLDVDATYMPRQRTMPGSWDSTDDEHPIFLTPPQPRHSPSAISRTASSVFSALFPFSQPRSIASTSLVVSSPSACPVPSHNMKRPSARASSTGVFPTSTSPQTYSHLTSSQYRSTSSDKAIRKALRKGSSVTAGRSRCRAIDRSTKAPTLSGHKNSPKWTCPLPVADDTSASPVSAPVPKSFSTPEKIKKTEVFSPVGEVQPAEAQMEVETYVTTYLSPPKPAPTSLAAKLKLDGFRCGSAPLAAFSRYLQPFKPIAPLPMPSAPLQDAPSVEMVMSDVPPSPHTPRLPFDPMELDQPSRVASPTSPSTTSTSPGILREVSELTMQFSNLKIQPPPVDISSLVEMMARSSLNDNQEKAPISQPFPPRSRKIHQAKPPSTSSFASSQATPSSFSGQSSSVPAPAATVKTEKKVARAPSRPSTSATSEPPMSATPATPQRPAGQPSRPAARSFSEYRLPIDCLFIFWTSPTGEGNPDSHGLELQASPPVYHPVFLQSTLQAGASQRSKEGDPKAVKDGPGRSQARRHL
ncbi:hypothetical protein KVR01_001460 [Diaporthe batatas]|uniref:uncharacterized protein n=1 Tax=Diaporthe batatas TaxID=748121 RepID=UPI001D0562DF|nr:uncharacterized protein KVR01_001460 [Diaporthe batatas]KAG8168711.1 hypothetical protein KVR01_001460 [Diaporthe batatas]